MNVTYRFYGAGYVSGKLNAQNVGIKIGDNFISNGPIYCAGQVYGDGTTYTPSITIANNVETSIGDNLVGTWFYAGGSLTGSSTASKGTLSIGGDIRTTIGNGANLSSGEFIGAGSTSTAGGCAVAGNVTTTIDGISTYNFTAAGKATAANGKSIVGFDIDGNPSATGGNVSTTIKSCTIKSSYYGAGKGTRRIFNFCAFPCFCYGKTQRCVL